MRLSPSRLSHYLKPRSLKRRPALFAGILLTSLSAAAVLPPWMQHAVHGTAIEAALYRVMQLPGVSVLFPRPPKESVAELSKLAASSAQPELYSLRAQQEEQALDFTAAEADWKTFTAKAADHTAAEFALADFYDRRHNASVEFSTLLAIAAMPAPASDAFTATASQPAWTALERAAVLATNQSLDDASFNLLWQRWTERYPQQATVYGRAFNWQVNHQHWDAAEAVLAAYRKAVSNDAALPVKGEALLALRHGGEGAQKNALAAYDAAFRPLAPGDLDNYFALLAATHTTRSFIAAANAKLAANPDDLDALARIFYYDQHQQLTPAALAALDAYSASKDARHAAWTADELHTLAYFASSAGAPVTAARYDFALYNTAGNIASGQSAKEAGLADVIALLLNSPDQPIALGAGNLSMYRDIATLDQGPGYWNGVLSLWFNGQSPQNQFAAAEQKAQPYFHRSKAVELLALLDRDFPNATARPALHAQLIQAYAAYSDNAAIVTEGQNFLAAFPHADSRLDVSLAMADAYARQKNTAAEFALYDQLLQELAAATHNMPLSVAALGAAPASDSTDTATTPAPTPNPAAAAAAASVAAMSLYTGPPTSPISTQGTQYSTVLDRYVGRLTATNDLPQALAVLRKELDRNPADPLLYERLAAFLQQNNLSAQQEQVYKLAIDKFQSTSWYDELSRFYIRTKRDSDYAALSKKITDTFSGTEVDAYFAKANGVGAQLAVQLNLYAHNRFPHDLVFTQNLLTAYSTKATANAPAHADLLRQVWWQSPDLTRQFFEYLSSTNKLDAELAALHPGSDNPAAEEEAAQGLLWRSQFEQSAPLYTTLSATYPANEDIGTTAADLNRSLAWLEPDAKPEHIATAVSIEERLLSEHPADLARLAQIGDILADHADDSPAGLAASSIYWQRMPTVAPGVQDSWLQSATVFWDYFQFDAALAQIKAARAHFQDPTLFGYEAGAIDENRRDVPAAVQEYVAAALAAGTATPSATTDDSASDPATDRLRYLARQKDSAALVDRATSNLGDSAAALGLRVTVLTALHRQSEASALLLAALGRATTADQAAAIDTLAISRQLDAVHAPALMREAALTPDPVERLQLTYALVAVYQSRNDLAQASQLIDATYKANPKLLGVVRSTVDYDWQNGRKPQAIATLLDASHSARSSLGNQFLAEAASKANDSGNPQQARAIAVGLLQQDPYNVEYIALAADSYSRANDPAGLKTFFLSRIDALNAPASTAPQVTLEQRKVYTAQLRKAFIPALNDGKDYDGALAQYIALISAYPDDVSLINDAALYALRYGKQETLLTFYQTTTVASPKDSRFFVALAQTASLDGNTTLALDAYTHAIALRKDRADLFIARASLEEQLQQFDQAAADYQQIYQLTYKDPQWMVALARDRARQGRGADAAAALKLAYMSSPRLVPHDRFVVAAQLEKWGLLDQAADFAQQGLKAAGANFFTGDTANIAADDPATYARIMTRLRKAPAAFTVLHNALAASNTSASSPSVIAAQVAAEGVTSVTDSDWRKQRAAAQRTQAEAGYATALNAMGTAVLTYYTPEEKSAYELALKQQAAGATPHLLQTFWIPAANSAGLSEQEAAWRKQLVLAPGNAAQDQIASYVSLENARMAFSELGHTLEAFIASHSRLATSAMPQVADAYHDAGDTASEARGLRPVMTRDPVDQGLRDRYLSLLLHHDTPVLLALASSKDDTVADAAANVALSGSSAPLALAAVHARAKSLPAAWANSYTGLTALYFRDTSASSGAAFRNSLDTDASIAQHLATRTETTHVVTGAVWFYDAARYGQWLTLSPDTSADAEDFLPADLEGAATAQNYTVLAHTYDSAGNTAAALIEIHHALELDPDDADALDLEGVLLWNAGRKPEAIDAWRAAFAALRHIEDRAAAPESFWTGFTSLAQHVHAYGLYTQLKPAMDDVLGIYLVRNGDYRSNELLHAAYTAAPSPAEGTAWILALAAQAKYPTGVLGDLAVATWLPDATRELVLVRQIDLARAEAATSTDKTDYAHTHVEDLQLTLLTLYVKGKQSLPAETLLASFNEKQLALPSVQQLQMVLAARDGSLPSLIAGFRAHPETAPASDTLNLASHQLISAGSAPQARLLEEFNFDRGLSQHSLTDADFLALAELRLLTGDQAGGVSLLHSLVQSPGDVYVHLDAAAALLEEHKDFSDAVLFLKPLANGVPWNALYTVRLAEAESQAGSASSAASLAAVARDPLAPYSARSRAARDLAKSSSGASTGLGSAELNLLATGHVSPEAARKPFFVAARIAAAEDTEDASTQAALLREVVALAPYTTIHAAVRVYLFRAQVASGNFSAAQATLNALLDPNLASEAQDASGTSADAATDDSTADASDAASSDTTSADDATTTAMPASAHVSTAQDSAALALQFAKVYEATGDSDDALAWLHFAIRQQPSKASAGAKAQIVALKAAAQLITANASRRPVIHSALDQPTVVRPRLSAASAAGGAPDAGAAQEEK